jgi:hypothetical protein
MRVFLPLRPGYVFHLGARVYAPSPEITIEVRSKYGDFVPVLFKVDTGADLTTIPIPVAEEKALSFSKEHPGSAIGIVGRARKYAGSLHVRIAGKEYQWPCDFTERRSVTQTPEAPDNPVQTSLSPVLGRAGFLDCFTISVDSRYLTITRLSPFLRWWRRCWRRIWFAIHPVHDPDRPL